MQSNPPLSLISFLISLDPAVFYASCSSDQYPLCIAAQYSTSVELLQILLLINASLNKKKTSSFHRSTLIPLGTLCARKLFPAQTDMVRCLIEVDNSLEIIENGISSCLASISKNWESNQMSDITPGSIGHHVLTLVDMLLNANPEAAKCDSVCMLLNICNTTRGDLFKSLISLFLAANKDVLQIGHTGGECKGDLVIHMAAQFNNVKGIKYLLTLYPESATMTAVNRWNMLQYTMIDDRN